jgi:hypothetical protein
MKNSLLLLFSYFMTVISFSVNAEERKVDTTSIEIQDSASFSEPEWVKVFQEDNLQNVNIQKMLAIKKARLGFLVEADNDSKDVEMFRQDIEKDLASKRAEFSRVKSETEALVKERNHLKESNRYAEDKVKNLSRSIGQGISKQIAVKSDIIALKKRLSAPVYRMEIVSLSGTADVKKISDKLQEFHSESSRKVLKGVVLLDRDISGKLFVIHDVNNQGEDKVNGEPNHLRAENFL